jgi:hypothetical protein
MTTDIEALQQLPEPESTATLYPCPDRDTQY